MQFDEERCRASAPVYLRDFATGASLSVAMSACLSSQAASKMIRVYIKGLTYMISYDDIKAGRYSRYCKILVQVLAQSIVT